MKALTTAARRSVPAIFGLGALILALAGTGAANATTDGCAIVRKTPDGFLNIRKTPNANSIFIGKFVETGRGSYLRQWKGHYKMDACLEWQAVGVGGGSFFGTVSMRLILALSAKLRLDRTAADHLELAGVARSARLAPVLARRSAVRCTARRSAYPPLFG